MAITLIIKGTRKCNLRCSYCHDWRAKDTPLSLNSLRKIIELAQKTDNNVTYVWHGGEPLLLGIAWYKQVLRIQDEFKSDKSFIRNTLQTNATLLTQEWCDFFKSNSFSVGVSIDGPEIIHNSTRYDIKNKGTYFKVLNGIKLLQLNSISFGLLMVVGKSIIDLGTTKIYHWLKEIEAPSIAFLPQRPDTNDLLTQREPSASSYFLDREAYSKFLFEIMQLWWIDDGRGPKIRELESLLEGIVNGKPNLCVFAGSCVGKYFGVDPDGSIYHCDRFIPEREYIVGNIDDKGFSFSNPIIDRIRDKVLIQELEIEKKCKWYEACHGGCPHDRHADPKGFLERGKCCGMNKILDDLFEKVSNSLMDTNKTAGNRSIVASGAGD